MQDCKHIIHSVVQVLNLFCKLLHICSHLLSRKSNAQPG